MSLGSRVTPGGELPILALKQFRVNNPIAIRENSSCSFSGIQLSWTGGPRSDPKSTSVSIFLPFLHLLNYREKMYTLGSAFEQNVKVGFPGYYCEWWVKYPTKSKALKLCGH